MIAVKFEEKEKIGLQYALETLHGCSPFGQERIRRLRFYAPEERAALEEELYNVEQAANAQTKLYTVTVSVPSDVSGLLSGMFADVTFHTDTASGAIVVPTESILTSGSTQYVYVVQDDNTAKYIEVTTGLTGNGVTEVTSGLSAGQQLVTVGQSYLSDGAAVRVVSGED